MKSAMRWSTSFANRTAVGMRITRGYVLKPSCGTRNEINKRLERLDQFELKPKPTVDHHGGKLPETIDVDKSRLLEPSEFLLKIAVIVRPMITARSRGADFSKIGFSARRAPHKLVEVFVTSASISFLECFRRSADIVGINKTAARPQQRKNFFKNIAPPLVFREMMQRSRRNNYIEFALHRFEPTCRFKRSLNKTHAIH